MKNIENHNNESTENFIVKYTVLFSYIICTLLVISFIGLLGFVVVNNNSNTDKPSDEDTSWFEGIGNLFGGDNSSADEDSEDNTEDNTEEDSSNTDKEEVTATPVDFTTLTYTAIGDSITYGFCGDHSKPAFSNNYPACVKSYLGLEEVTNLGACGCLVSRNTNTAYTSMIDKVDLISADADIISVFGGINDFACYAKMGDINSTDEYTIYGAFNLIASKLKNNYPDAFVFFITPLPLGESNLTEINNTSYTVRDVCNAILEVGEKWNIPVFDANLYADFNPDTHSFDGCHPTEAYYATTFSSKIVAFIRENYQ